MNNDTLFLKAQVIFLSRINDRVIETGETGLLSLRNSPKAKS